MGVVSRPAGLRRLAARLARWPTRGGWLTIVNALAWGAMALGGLYRGVTPFGEGWRGAVYWVFATPVAWFFVPVRRGYGDVEDLWFVSVVIGLNAFAWGYGLSWLWGRAGWESRRLREQRRRIRFRCCVACGYDCRATPERCPECGLDAPFYLRARGDGRGTVG
jgi:hypothetical protein